MIIKFLSSFYFSVDTCGVLSGNLSTQWPSLSVTFLTYDLWPDDLKTKWTDLLEKCEIILSFVYLFFLNNLNFKFSLWIIKNLVGIW